MLLFCIVITVIKWRWLLFIILLKLDDSWNKTLAIFLPIVNLIHPY